MRHYLVTATLLFSVNAYAGDWQSFVVPESLGQNVDDLNIGYHLGLERMPNLDIDKDTLAYVAENEGCGYIVNTNQDHNIKRIHIYQNLVGDIKECQFKTDNPIAFELDKTSVNQLLLPIRKGVYNIYPTEYFITPICFYCSASGTITDVLEIYNAKEDFKIQFEVLGDMADFQKEVATTYLNLKRYNSNKHYEYMKKLEKKFENNVKLFKTEKFKKLAFKHYGNSKVLSYTLSLK